MATNDKAWRIGFRREIGDESNPTWAIPLGGTSFALHLIDPLHAGTDWDVAASTTPTLYIHGSGAAPTEYINIYTDQTDAHINIAGANLDMEIPTGKQFGIQVNDTDEYLFDGTTFTIAAGNTIDFSGSALVKAATDIHLVVGSASYLKLTGTAIWTAGSGGTVVMALTAPGSGGSLISSAWLTVKDNAGTIRYIPGFIAL